MGQMTANHLFLIRLDPEAAASWETGVTSLFRLAEKYSEGNVTVDAGSDDNGGLTVLRLPPQVPFQPCVVHVEDVVLVSTSEELAQKALPLVRGEGGESLDMGSKHVGIAIGELACLLYFALFQGPIY
jgi:hypothetical protein